MAHRYHERLAARTRARRPTGQAQPWPAKDRALVGAALLRIAPGPVVAWLCNDASFVVVGVRVLAIASIGLLFVGARDVMEASFGGVGNTIPPVVIGLTIALARFPLAWVIALRMDRGGLGVSWAVNVSLIAQAALLLAWFLFRFKHTAARAIEPIAASIPPPAERVA